MCVRVGEVEGEPPTCRTCNESSAVGTLELALGTVVLTRRTAGDYKIVIYNLHKRDIGKNFKFVLKLCWKTLCARHEGKNW